MGKRREEVAILSFIVFGGEANGEQLVSKTGAGETVAGSSPAPSA